MSNVFRALNHLGLSQELRSMRAPRTQSEIAEEIGVKSITYGSWERKGILPRKPDLLDRLSKALGTTSDKLLEISIESEKTKSELDHEKDIYPLLVKIIASPEIKTISINEIYKVYRLFETCGMPYKQNIVDVFLREVQDRD